MKTSLSQNHHKNQRKNDKAQRRTKVETPRATKTYTDRTHSEVFFGGQMWSDRGMQHINLKLIEYTSYV